MEMAMEMAVISQHTRCKPETDLREKCNGNRPQTAARRQVGGQGMVAGWLDGWMAGWMDATVNAISWVNNNKTLVITKSQLRWLLLQINMLFGQLVFHPVVPNLNKQNRTRPQMFPSLLFALAWGPAERTDMYIIQFPHQAVHNWPGNYIAISAGFEAS